MYKISHLTSVHTRYDTRIFLKQCSSLAKGSNFKVNLIVADNKPDEVKNNVSIQSIGSFKGRFDRLLNSNSRIFKKAMELNSDIYQLHDPELIPVGLKLLKKGKKVIFDAHEDLPKQLKSKPYLNSILKMVLPLVAKIYESWACKKYTAIFSATPMITEKFKSINANSHTINNFPILGELESQTEWKNKLNEVSFVGGITEIRGVREFVKAFEYTGEVSLNLVGQFSNKALEDEVKVLKGWSKANFLGFLSRIEVRDVLARSKVGLVTYYAEPNHVEAQPNKMFEYMSAGVPVIASHFPMWREVIEGNSCGICVDPLNSKEIGAAITKIVENDQLAEKMGLNGQKAVKEKYNWTIEEAKLISIYTEILEN